MSGLEIHGLSKSYRINGKEIPAVADLDLHVKNGTFLSVVGKSGCGKTTLLRLICGLEKPDNGTIHFTGEDNRKKRVSIVFQEPRLMPWLTVRQNMAFALVMEKKRKETDSIIDNFLEMLGLQDFQHAYPGQISGGMAQRTALGRTLCFNPDIILMDEPFGALDAFTRRNLQEELVEIFLKQKKTVVFVTHDVDEAVLLSQGILIMDRGRVIREMDIHKPYPRNALDKDFVVAREKILSAILEKQ